MSTLPTFDLLNERVSAGERLTDAELAELAATPDILLVGMLADTVRRRLHGPRVTYLRVAVRPVDEEAAYAVPEAAREVRIAGTPASLGAALSAVERARVAAGNRTVAGFSWVDVVRLAASDGTRAGGVLSLLRKAGLDALAELPLDRAGDVTPAVESVCEAGFQQVRLTVERAAAAERTSCLLKASALQERHGRIRSLNPLPTVLQPFRPTTGYEDVRAVALARLAAPDIPTIQVDWTRYGPKLAQVALTFGADDLDVVSAADDAPDGPRRAPLEEVRRNIVAAGFVAAERDGRFSPVS